MKDDSANLDFIRAIAVLCVAYAHLRDLLMGPADISWHIAQLGILTFFVHTSLVLMMSLERTVRRLDGAALVTDFYVRRFFRIYPLTIVCVTLAFVGLVPTSAEPQSWLTYLANLTLTTNLSYSEEMWPGLWTLPLEIQMYVILPVLFLWLRGRALWWAFAAWGLAVVGGLIAPQISGRLTVAQWAPCFVAGVIAWRLMRIYARPRWSAAWWPLVFVASWIVWFQAPRHGYEYWGYYRWGFTLTLGCLIPWFHDLSWRPLVVLARTIAKYSYGIYLSHYVIIVFALAFDGPLRWLILIGLLGLVPVAMYHLIEQPLIEVGRRVAARMVAESSWLRPYVIRRP